MSEHYYYVKTYLVDMFHKVDQFSSWLRYFIIEKIIERTSVVDLFPTSQRCLRITY